MKRDIKRITVALVVFMLISAPAFSMGNCPRWGHKGGYMEKKARIMKELNLTQDQEKLLKETKEAHRAEMKKLFEATKEKRQALKDAMKKTGVTKKDVEPILADMKKLQAETLDRRTDGIFKVKSILTPEQFEKMQDMKKGKHGRYHKKDGWKGW